VRNLIICVQKLQEEGRERRNQQVVDTLAELNDIQEYANEFTQQNELYRERINYESQERRENLIAEANERKQTLIKNFEVARQLQINSRDTLSQFFEADATEEARNPVNCVNSVDQKVPSIVVTDLEAQTIEGSDNYYEEVPPFTTPNNYRIPKSIYILVCIVLLIIITIVCVWVIPVSTVSKVLSGQKQTLFTNESHTNKKNPKFR